MTFAKINETEYPAIIRGKVRDQDWDDRESKAITIEMPFADADSLFVDGLNWSIVEKDDAGIITEEYDNSEFCVAGDITDHRNGAITAKMGKVTDLEAAYELIYG